MLITLRKGSFVLKKGHSLHNEKKVKRVLGWKILNKDLTKLTKEQKKKRKQGKRKKEKEKWKKCNAFCISCIQTTLHHYIA